MQQNDINNIIENLKNKDIDKNKIDSAVNLLNDEQKNMLNSILNDPQALRNIMSSPKARSIMDELK